MRRKNAPKALSLFFKLVAAMSKAVVARFLVGCTPVCFTLPPVMRLFGHRCNQEVKCLTVGHGLILVPISLLRNFLGGGHHSRGFQTISQFGGLAMQITHHT